MSLAFVFPGQGSQSVGMLNALAGAFPSVQETFAEASQALGLDLWGLVANGPEDQLNLTHNTQPAMLAAGVAVYRVWLAQEGLRPAYMAGHSLGEYTALVCAGSLDFAEAVRLVADRGRYMQGAVPAGVGAMAAILGLDDDAVRKVCRDAQQGEVVEAVNFNSPGQVVVAGHSAAVQRAVELAKAAGAKRAVMLPVSAPSHCALMQPAAEKLAVRLAGIHFQAPQVPVVQNADVAAYNDVNKIRDGLVRQLYMPVRWVESVQYMAAQGVSEIIECGPGKVLAGLNKRIDKNVKASAIFDPATLAEALGAVKVSA
ncbi:MAG: ACP S-malonyltransferase [Gammaproteobacteria bacterium]|nr:ACP S-malonyltransferase [Gammaproteobacteria bacterium]